MMDWFGFQRAKEMEKYKSNVLITKSMLQSVFEMRGVEFNDWKKDWKEIDNFYCRTTRCSTCLSCQLECFDYESKVSLETTSWSECDYPYGFSIDKGLTREQQTIVALIVVLAIVFVVFVYYILREVFLKNSNRICDVYSHNVINCQI